MPSLFIEHLDVRRGDYRLAARDLSIPSAGTTWILGENGSGKSTLLDVLAGRRRPAGRDADRRNRLRGSLPLPLSWSLPITPQAFALVAAVLMFLLTGYQAAGALISRRGDSFNTRWSPAPCLPMRWRRE
jgi:energy-coupling factor transporter ATP-binding protein EcfA2